MKSMLLIITLLIHSATLFATEIQCQSNVEGIDIVIKKSPQTQLFYLLLFKEENVLPIRLNSSSIFMTDKSLNYNHDEVKVFINLEELVGEVELKDSLFTLSKCKIIQL